MAPRLGHVGSGFLSVEDNEDFRRVFACPETCVPSYVCVCVWERERELWEDKRKW
jgi:hypothetical protein